MNPQVSAAMSARSAVRRRLRPALVWAASRRRPGTLSGVPFLTWAIGLLVGSLVLSLPASAIDSPAFATVSGAAGVLALASGSG